MASGERLVFRSGETLKQSLPIYVQRIHEHYDSKPPPSDFPHLSLRESSGTIHADYPYFGCELLGSSTCVGTEVGEGGPLITETGHVCGINFFDGCQCVHPLPISVILFFLDTWTCNRIVMQPWFGMTVIDISELPCYALDKVARVCGDGTAVIKEVYEGSPADIAGVRPGDSVVTLISQVSNHDFLEAVARGLTNTLKEVSVSSATEYALALRSISKDLNDDSTRDIMVILHNDSDEDVVVRALNLRVDDKRFCSSWSEDKSKWHEPLFGSQTQPAYDVAINTNPPVF